MHCNSNIDKKLANSSLRFFSFKKFVDYKKNPYICSQIAI